jgi:hypothetical protein
MNPEYPDSEVSTAGNRAVILNAEVFIFRPSLIGTNDLSSLSTKCGYVISWSNFCSMGLAAVPSAAIEVAALDGGAATSIALHLRAALIRR